MRLRGPAAVIAAAALAASGLMVSPTPAFAFDPSASDSVPGWTVGGTAGVDAAVTFDANGYVGHAVRIENRTPTTPNTFATLRQSIPVAAGTTYQFSAMVRSTGLDSPGALSVVLSDDWGERFDFPQGSYDWRELTWSYTARAGQTVMNLIFLSQDVTPGLLIDELRMVAEGDDRNLIRNGSFSLQLTDPLRHSSEFRHWTIGASGLMRGAIGASPEGRTGDAIEIQNLTPLAPNTFLSLHQAIAVKPDTEYEFSLWVKSAGLAFDGSVSLILSDDWGTRHDVKGGVYNWQEETWTYRTAADQTVLNLRILSQDVVASVMLDDLTITAVGDPTNVVSNGGFEDHSAYFGLTNDSLLFAPGEATLRFLTDDSGADSMEWAIRDAREVEILDGSTALTAGRGKLTLAELAPGFYTVTASLRGGAESSFRAAFGVIPAMPAAARAEASPFGVGIHGFDPTTIAGLVKIGMKHVRTDAEWANVELTPGQYDFPYYITNGFGSLHDAGLTPLPISNYRNPNYDDNRTPSSPAGLAAFGAYTAALNAHLGNYTEAVEIYNEFNINFNDGLCGRGPQCYAELLTAAASAVKAANPNAVIVGPAISGASEDYIREVLNAGGSDALDVVSFHPYRHPQAPEGMDDQMASVANAIRQASGRDIPMWLTEYGWPSNTPVTGITDVIQGSYLIRSAALNLAGGVERIYWYDARDDGTDPSYQEHNFGLFEVPRYESINAAEPKVAAIAHAVLAAKLAGLPVSGQDDLDGDAESVVFGQGANTARVMWVPEGSATARLTANDDVTVVSMFGAETTLTPVDGQVEVGLSGHPVIVRGQTSQVEIVASPRVTISTPATLARGEAAPLKAVVDTTGGDCDQPTELEITIEGVSKAVTAEGCGITEVPFEVDVPTTADAFWVTGSAATAGRTFASLASGTMTVAEAITAKVTLSTVKTGADWAQNAKLTISNESTSATITLDGVEWSAGASSGTVNATDTLTPGASVSHDILLSDLGLWDQAYLEAEVGVVGRPGIQLRQSVGIAPIEPDDAANLPWIDLLGNTDWHNYTGDPTGEEDLSGTARITWTPAGLRFQAQVRDDVFHQNNPASGLYNGDSVQISFSPRQPGMTTARTEIGLALVPSGPTAYTFEATGVAITGLTPVNDLSIERDGAVTTYDVVIPWQSFGVNEAPTGTFALSFIVNEDDGAGREGFLEWSSGIGLTKNTGQHFPVQLVDAAEPEPEPDTTPPTITVKPESKGRDGVYREVSFTLFDDGKVDRLTLNGVEKDLTDNTSSDLNEVKPGAFGGVEGENELQVFDLAGNVTTLAFVLDVTAPTVTVKDGQTETVGTAQNGYEVVSFKLYDKYRVDRLTLNGVEKDLTDNTWSDLNLVKPGRFGAVAGDNELNLHDVAGNVTTLSFRLVDPAPAVAAWESKKVYNSGDQVSYNSAIWVAQWWTQNQKPGDPSGPWMEQGVGVPEAGTDVRVWTASWVYNGGETVAHNGHTWKAKWWTRNQKPGDQYGPWQDLGAY